MQAYSPKEEKQLTELLSLSETLWEKNSKSSGRKSSDVSIFHEPVCHVRLSISTKTLSGQACLIIVKRRLIRTKRYHDYKAKIAANVAAQMMLDGTECLPRGTLYRVEIGFSTKGWGVDVDNAAKAILDALIGVAIDDDRAIVELEIKKETHAKKEGLTLAIYSVGSRPVAAPAKKREANKAARAGAGKVRPRRSKNLGGNNRYKRKVKGK